MKELFFSGAVRLQVFREGLLGGVCAQPRAHLHPHAERVLSSHKKTPTSLGSPRSLGMVLLEGPGGLQFLKSEVPLCLHSHAERVRPGILHIG